MSQGVHSTLIERLDALYEYEREPIKEQDLHGWKAVDVLLGLFIGNLLAVLSWAFICAPIAVKTRLTQYWQLRKLGGPWLTVAYSAVFGVILCVLAGAMLRV